MLLSSAARTLSVAPGVGRRAASALALKYSKALFGAALKKQAVDKVAGEVDAVATTLKSNPELREYVFNPTIPGKERVSTIDALLGKVEGSGAKKQPVSDITKNFFNVLSENGRLGETEEIIEGFNELLAAHRGELNVVVTSATPLAKDVLTRLESTLKQSQAAQAAKVLKITNKVNPSVLGGIIVDFGDKTIDLSVQSRVTKLNNLITRTLILR
ncbi:ATP synthase subunit 5 [Cyathus striatus]|nr:ATP synthase subunit 5 [Cyathus striatus]